MKFYEFLRKNQGGQFSFLFNSCSKIETCMLFLGIKLGFPHVQIWHSATVQLSQHHAHCLKRSSARVLTPPLPPLTYLHLPDIPCAQTFFSKNLLSFGWATMFLCSQCTGNSQALDWWYKVSHVIVSAKLYHLNCLNIRLIIRDLSVVWLILCRIAKRQKCPHKISSNPHSVG